MVFRWLLHFLISISPPIGLCCSHFIIRMALSFSFNPFWKHPDRCTPSCASWAVLNTANLTLKIIHHTFWCKKHMLFCYLILSCFWKPLSSSILFWYSVQQVPTIIKQSHVQVVAFPFDEYFQIECEAKGNPEPK